MWAWLVSLFNRFKPLSLPFPEEKPDYSQTVENVSITDSINKWLTKYSVPVEFHNFWRTKIKIYLDPDYQYPSGVWEEGGVRNMRIRPEFVNPGLIAHEQAHNSYSLLTDSERQLFSIAYAPLKKTDAYIKLLYRTNTYGLTNDVEAHAEIYRYIGPEKMPAVLRQYYPKLI